METTVSISAKELAKNLHSFTGTSQYYQHKLPGCGELLLTDGCDYLRENAAGGSYWLFDLILSWQMKLRSQRFQVWRLVVQDDDSAEIECTDGNKNFLCSQDIPFTDFPLKEIVIWVVDGVALLPSEY